MLKASGMDPLGGFDRDVLSSKSAAAVMVHGHQATVESLHDVEVLTEESGQRECQHLKLPIDEQLFQHLRPLDEQGYALGFSTTQDCLLLRAFLK